MGDAEAADALERTVLELEAMAAIFGSDFADDSEGDGEEFVVTTPDALKSAQSAIDCGDVCEVPRIEVEVLVRSASDGIDGRSRLRIELPPGYPSLQSAEVTVLSTEKNLPRRLFDALSCKLQLRAKELVGAEAILEIITECRDAMESWTVEEAAPNNKNDIEDEIAAQKTLPLASKLADAGYGSITSQTQAD
ncbi:hypothetical protein ACHAXT_001239 [Thalassiosira profunda]